MPPFLKFALRSWLYVLLHAAVAAPAARVLPKPAAFRLVKAALALASAASELWLCRAADQSADAEAQSKLDELIGAEHNSIADWLEQMPDCSQTSCTATAGGVLS